MGCGLVATVCCLLPPLLTLLLFAHADAAVCSRRCYFLPIKSPLLSAPSTAALLCSALCSAASPLCCALLFALSALCSPRSLSIDSPSSANADSFQKGFDCMKCCSRNADFYSWSSATNYGELYHIAVSSKSVAVKH